MMAIVQPPNAVKCQVTCLMPGGYSAPGVGTIAGGQTVTAALLPAEVERLQRQFTGRLLVTTNGDAAPPPVRRVVPRAQPEDASPFGLPAPYYGRDETVGAEALRATLASEEHRAARVVAEYAALVAQQERPLRVATLFEHFGLGGAEWAWHQVATATDRTVCEHRLLVTTATHPLLDDYRAEGLDVAVKPERADLSRWLAKQYAWADVVEYPFVSVWRSVPVPPADVAVVAARHNCRSGAFDGPLPRKPDLFACVSPAAAFTLRTACPAVPRVVLPHGLASFPRNVTSTVPSARRKQVRASLGIPQDATVCVWAGRMHADEKGLPLLRRAIAETPGVVWLVVGYFAEGQEAQAVEWQDFIAGKPVVWVRDAGPAAMPDYYRAADIGTSTSSREGFGLTLLEAAAAGLPLVATDSGGPRYVLLSGANGYLSKPNAETDFLANLRAMIEGGKALWRRMGKAGLQLVAARFDPAIAAQERAVEYAAVAERCARPLPVPAEPAAALRALQPAIMPPPAWDVPRVEKPLRIAFLSEMPTVGGLIWRAAQTALGLKRMGHTVKLFYRRETDGIDLLPWLKAAKLPVQVGTGDEDDMLAALRRWRPDVVQRAWPPHGDLPAGPVPWCKVAWFAGPSAVRAMGNATQVANIDRWVLVSEEMLAHLPAGLHQRATVIRNAIPPLALPDREAARRALGLHRHDFAVLWAGGRLNDTNKGQDRARKLLADVPGMRLLVAGDATQAEAVAAEVRAEPSALLIDGLRPWEMPLAYAAADAFVQMSKHEGLSVALLEAAHAGLPVVASAVGGTADVLGDCGRLFHPDDLPAAAEALRYLRDHRDERQAMGERLQARVRQGFDWTAYLRAYSDLYAEQAEEVRA